MCRSFLAMTTAALVAAATITAARADEGPSSLMEHGQLRRAAALSEARIKSNPKDAEALRVLAVVRGVQKRFDEANDLAERAVAAAPSDPGAHYTWGQIAGMPASTRQHAQPTGGALRKGREGSPRPNFEDAIRMIAFHRQAPVHGATRRRRRFSIG
jgi:hypothetical protein